MVLEFIDYLMQIFDPVFMILSLLFGYLVFFVYFYDTAQWRNLQWGDRALLGWILGTILFVTTVSFTPSFLSIWNELTSHPSLSYQSVQLCWFMDWLLLVLALFFFRSSLHSSLHSEGAKQEFDGFLERDHVLAVYSIVVFLVFGWFLIPYEYPGILLPYLQSIWSRFIPSVVILILFSYASTLMVLYALTHIPHVDFSSLRRVIVPGFRFGGTWNDRTIRRYVLATIVVLLLSIAVISFDSGYALMTPKVTLVESRYATDDYVHVTRYEDMKFVGLVLNERVFHVRSPVLTGMAIKAFTIGNPSNATLPFPYQPRVTASGLGYTLLSQASGEVTDLQFTLNSEDTTSALARVEYYDELADTTSFLQFDETGNLHGQVYPNGTINGLYVLRMVNIGKVKVAIDQVALFRISGMNVTSFDAKVETTVASQSYAYGSVDAYGGFAYLRGGIGPGSSITVSISLLYRE